MVIHSTQDPYRTNINAAFGAASAQADADAIISPYTDEPNWLKFQRLTELEEQIGRIDDAKLREAKKRQVQAAKQELGRIIVDNEAHVKEQAEFLKEVAIKIVKYFNEKDMRYTYNQEMDAEEWEIKKVLILVLKCFEYGSKEYYGEERQTTGRNPLQGLGIKQVVTAIDLKRFEAENMHIPTYDELADGQAPYPILPPRAAGTGLEPLQYEVLRQLQDQHITWLDGVLETVKAKWNYFAVRDDIRTNLMMNTVSLAGNMASGTFDGGGGGGNFHSDANMNGSLANFLASRQGQQSSQNGSSKQGDNSLFNPGIALSA